MTAEAAPRPGPGLPLTAAQRGMWFAQALDPDGTALNTAEYLEIRGALDPELFAAALHRTACEADALAVRITDTAGGPRQLPHPVPKPGRGFPLHRADLRAAPDPDAAAHAWMTADLARPFDLASGPLFRHALLRVGEQRWLWYQAVHHLVMDGFGYSLLARRTAELYTALAAGEPPPERWFGTLGDLVAEDAAYLASEQRGTDRAHWADVLADRPEPPLLGRGTALPSRTFLRRSARLSPAATARLREAADGLRATWPEVLVAVQALYVSRVAGSSRPVLGLPMMGRMGSASLRVPGMVMNVVPLALTVGPDTTPAGLVRQVVLGLRRARRHQRYRWEDIRRDARLLGEGRALAGPLVNVMPFDYALSFAGAPATAHNLSTGPVDDLSVHVYDRADGSGLRLDHDANPALYTGEEVDAHQRRYLELLERVAVLDPHAPLAAVPVATGEEAELVVRGFNDTARPLPATTLIGPIEARARRVPDAPALLADGLELTYAQLNARANRLAHRLIARGVGPGSTAAVALPRSAQLVTALLAVLKAGGAYLPLDPGYPPARLAYMLDDAAPACLVTDAATAARLPDGAPEAVLVDAADAGGGPAAETDPPRALSPHDPAYVIYTSGSTGRPKGVVVPHAAIDNRLRWMQDAFPIGPGDRVLQKTPSGFDVSVWEFFWPLREGAALVVAAPEAHRDPSWTARLVRERAVTVCHFVPSMLRLFLAAPESGGCGGLRHVFASGEALPRETVREFHRTLPGVALHNLYGPTEAAVDVSRHTCVPGADGPVPIGVPVWNTRLYVLDAAGQPCPPGVAGELYLAGAQLASGYLGRPELTAERFVPDPFGPPGARMYRTGDRARWTADGEVEYLGRSDDQVKLAGQRLEPGEIEARLTAAGEVAAACVLVREDRPGDQRLTAYVTAAGGPPPEPERLRARLAAQLPEFMVPSAVVVLDRFPLTPNGKLDRAALPAPAAASGAGSDRAPRTPAEETLARLFAEVLGVPRVGVEDRFFDLGGTSLLAARLGLRVREVLGAEVSLGALFAAPTPAALAARLADGAGPDDALRVLLPLRPSGGRSPLFAFHPAGGLGWCYSGLLSRLPAGQPVYGVQARGLRPGEPLPADLEAMAADYVQRLREVRPHGPYRLLGWSVGGVVAHSVAVRLREEGERVELLALLDAYPSDQWREQAAPTEAEALRALLRMAGYEGGGELTREDVLAALRREGSALAALPDDVLDAVPGVVVNNARLMRTHRHRVFDGDVLFFQAAAARAEHWLTPRAWAPYVAGALDVRPLDCTHPEITHPRQWDEIGAVLTARLKELDG